MLELKRNKIFIKDIKKLSLNDTQYKKYINYISKLLNEEPLPPEANGHQLLGEYEKLGYREFHVSGDLVLIYKIDGNVLSLVRIGSHNQVFV